MTLEGTNCKTCGLVIKYIYCDACNEFHSDPHDPDACTCRETYNMPEEALLKELKSE